MFLYVRARRPGAAAIFLIHATCGAFVRSLIYTVLAVYYVTTVRMDPLQLVLAGTVMEATIVVFEVPTGLFADLVSRRLSIIVGRLLFGVAYLVQGALPVFTVILLAEVVRGIGETFLSGATQAWLADEVGEDRLGALFLRAAQLRRLGALAGIGASVGLASVQLSLPITLGGGLSIGLGMFLLAFMPERGFLKLKLKLNLNLRPKPKPKPNPEVKREKTRPAWAIIHTASLAARQFRDRPTLLVFLGIAAGVGASSEAFDRLWEAHLLASFEFPGLGSLQPVVWFGILEAGAILAGLIALQVITLDSNHQPTVIRALLVIQSLWLVAVIGFGLAPGFIVVVAAFWSARVLTGVSEPLFQAWQTRTVPADLRATVLSAISQGDAVGQMLGGPLVGAIGTAVSLRAAMVVTGLVRAPVLALLGLTRRLG